MGILDELARARIKAWLKASGLTQTALSEQVGRNQAWMSRYLDAEYDADLDTLDRIARAQGHTLFHLLDVSPDPGEREILDMMRALRPDAREIIIKLLQEWTATARGRSRK